MLPQVQQREAQRQLEARWGLDKLREPKLQGGPNDQMRIPRILHQGTLCMLPTCPSHGAKMT